jgi:hypothetical protein
MTRYFLAVLLIPISAHFCPTPSRQSPATLPTVSISLPANIPSETVEIRYLLIGPFGGYGGFIEPKPNKTDYEIEASTQGRPANSIKILVYATGCKFRTFNLDLTQIPNPIERFVCESLPQIRIAGKIPSDLMLHENAELNVRYMAYWANSFFGTPDGPVIEFYLATTIPDSDGNFGLEIPDFSSDNIDSSHKDGASLSFTLRDSKTGNDIAFDLKPELPEYRSDTQQLKVLPSYPGVVKFIGPRY